MMMRASTSRSLKASRHFSLKRSSPTSVISSTRYQSNAIAMLMPKASRALMPGRIGRDRHLEELPEFGEIAHEVEDPIGILPVDPRYEARIVGACRAAVEAAGKPERPRHAALAEDAATVGEFAAGNQAQQRRLAGAVLADERDVAARERQRHGAEDVLPAVAELVGFGDVDEPDHVKPPRAAGSARRRARPASSPAPSRSGIRS